MVSINNSVNNKVGGSNSGATNTFLISNESNTASSQAREVISVGGSTADDPFTSFVVTGVTTWSAGIDNSDSDKFKISISAALGTSDALTLDTSGNAVITGSIASYRPTVTQSGSNTFALTDANTFQLCTSGSSMTLTIPLNATVAFAIGTEIDVYQQGAGQVSIAPTGGVTLNSSFSNRNIAVQYSGASLKKTAADTWELIGNLTA